MNCIWMFCAFILLLKVPSTQSVSVVLDESVVLPCEMRSCSVVQWSKVYPIQTTVAKCHNKICSVKESFQERFRFTNQTIEGNYSLLLNLAKYNDQGTYKCICDSISNNVILEIIVPIPVSVDESSNITLPCYSDTQTNVNDVTWLHNYSKVLHYMKNGSTNPGEDYEGRVSLTENGFKDGDLSLTITEAQFSDAGLYRCFVQDESFKGYPHAYMIHVCKNGGNKNSKINSLVRGHIITTFLLLFAAILVVSVLLICKSKMSKGQTTESNQIKLNSPI